jgi:hypothetical protein
VGRRNRQECQRCQELEGLCVRCAMRSVGSWRVCMSVCVGHLDRPSRVWWCPAVITATPEAEAGGS